MNQREGEGRTRKQMIALGVQTQKLLDKTQYIILHKSKSQIGGVFR